MGNEWLERELEEFVAADLYRFFGGMRSGSNIKDWELGIVGRQLRCRFGIIDLLVYSVHRDIPIPVYTITIVEFKAVQAEKKVVEQVMRYKAALDEIDIYEAVPSESFYDYAHMIDSYFFVETMIVAPSFSDATKWYPNRVIANRNENGFDFSFDEGAKGTRHDNRELQTALRPLIVRATESARQWHLSQQLQRGLDSTSTHTENN